MADNVPITAGSGTNIATDDAAAGGHVQIIKLAISADGSATVIPADATNGLDVDVTRVQGSVTVDSELPTAAALSDSTANPTSPMVGTGGMLFDGTDWRRMRTMDDAGANLATTGGFLANVPHLHDTGSSVTPMKRGAELTDADVGAWMPGAGMMMYNGTNWSRARGDTTNGLDVDVTRLPKTATATTSQVADNAASVTILAANAGRLGATITNDSSARLYIRLGAAAASTTNYSFSLAQHESWEPTDSVIFTGEIRGIWATDPGDGAARVTELTA